MSTADCLRAEIETYEKHKSQLIAESEGKYVLVHEEQIAGVWDTYQDALRVGYNRFGLRPFLVKQIQGVETVQHFTRDIPRCQ